MENDLIERYLYAVTNGMSPKIREDVAKELRGLIDDMLSERCGDQPPTEKDIRVVLTELGSPQELQEKYDGDGKNCLIGQPYYRTYKLVLKIVLVCAAFGITLANVLLQLMEPQVWYAAAAGWLAMLLQTVLGAFALVTLLFAFFYRKGIRISEPFNFDNLPPVPKKKQTISKWECIFGIGFSVLFTVVFLAAPQIICVSNGHAGELIPLFRPEAMQSSWFIIVLFALCDISREAVKLMDGRYTRRVLVVTVADNLLSVILAVWWLTGFELINPAFTESMATLFSEGPRFIEGLFRNFHHFFLGVMIFALLLDTVDTAVRTLRK